jgi:hypothetical protein
MIWQALARLNAFMTLVIVDPDHRHGTLRKSFKWAF